MTINTTRVAARPPRRSSARTSATWSCRSTARARWPGIPITDTQGFGIPTDAEGSRPHRRSSSSSCTARSASTRCGPSPRRSRPTRSSTRSLIDDPFLKDVYDKWWVGDHNAYVADLMPTLFWTDAMFVNSQKILGRRDDRRARPGRTRRTSARSGSSRIPTWSRTTRPGPRIWRLGSRSDETGKPTPGPPC